MTSSRPPARAPFSRRLRSEASGLSAVPRDLDALAMQGVGEVAGRIDQASDRARVLVALAIGLFGIGLAWGVQLSDPSLVELPLLGRRLTAATVLGALGGPIAVFHAISRLVWPPEPPVAKTATRFGAGVVEGQRLGRLWLGRLAGAAIGVVHFLVLMSIT